MKVVFADTLYWVAVLRPNDPYRELVRRVKRKLGAVELVTTEEVLVECLGFVAGGGSEMRRIGAEAVPPFVSSEAAA